MYRKDYYNENREREIEKVINYQKRQRKTNPKYRTTNNIRALFSNVLKKKQRSSYVIENYLGYDITTLKEHLLSTIPEGYSWEDFLEGKLVLEHIIPISAYEYKSYCDNEFKKCWNFRNMRLLPVEENILKGDMLNRRLVKQYEIEELLPA